MRPSLVQLGWTDRVAALAAASEAGHDAVVGRVVRVGRDSCQVVTALEESTAVGHPLPVVGDWVLVRRTDPAGPLQVVERLPRWSSVERLSAMGVTEAQVLAVNVDLVAIVVALDREPNPGRLDRELVVAWESGARPVVVLTKADAHPDPAAALRSVAEQAMGVEVIATSSRDGQGLPEVRAAIGVADTLVLLGASGAGKSTLANRLLGAEVLATGEVREGDRKGRHTTVARSLHAIPTGGVLIDTPGLRGLGLWDVTDGIDLAFPDITELAAGCRFDDCAHAREPGCAVRAAVAAGTLSVERFDSWTKLQEEAAHMDRQRDARARADQKRQDKQSTKALRARYRDDPRS